MFWFLVKKLREEDGGFLVLEVNIIGVGRVGVSEFIMEENVDIRILCCFEYKVLFECFGSVVFLVIF